MYIQPQSTFKVIRNVPFNSDMKHVIKFTSRERQMNYFEGKTKYNFFNFTYIRQTNSVKVPTLSDNLYDCNYCMFKNGDERGSRWFFAFITKVEYINEVTSEIFFEIDHYQTWLFDVSVGKCFVEREHVADDTIGKHTVLENIDYGENIIQSVYNLYWTNWKVCIQYTANAVTQAFIRGFNTLANVFEDTPYHDESLPDPSGHVLQKQYGVGYLFRDFDCSNPIVAQRTADDINQGIALLQANKYTIVNMFMYPSSFEIGSSPSSAPVITVLGSDNNIIRPNNYGNNVVGTLDRPIINNKLFTFPYTFCKVSNNQGVECDFKWENSEKKNTIDFRILTSLVNGASCTVVPVGYECKGTYIENQNRRYTIPMIKFPTCIWTEDSFLTNLQSNLLSFAISASTGAMKSQTIITHASENINNSSSWNNTEDGYGTWGSKDITKNSDRTKTIDKTTINPTAIRDNILPNVGKMVSAPVTAHGGNSVSTVDIAHDMFGYSFYTMGIKPEYARIIDDYFTRYGYKVNEYKVPELSSRTRFNYVKTNDCNIVGDAPNEALELLSRMYDSGVTIWHTTDVGDFTVNNDITVL